MTSSSGPSKTQALYRKAKTLIPGGTQLLSKRPEQFAPDQWPAYYREAHGCTVIDLDGREYLDMSIMGIGSCLLGYRDPDVTEAVVQRIQHGSMCTLNNPEEVELAGLLIDIHPWADQVRYARAGGESMAIAARIARAATKRNLVAICGYHGWHDWYLAANLGQESALDGHLLPGLSPNGVPTSLGGTILPFEYNRLDQLEAIVARHRGDLAAVIMEPTRSSDPAPGFLEGVRSLCDETGAVLVFDEISVGWRLILGGAHRKYNVEPDIAVFAKAISNGHAMAAVIGRAAVMQAAQESFISSTYWTEGVGPTAAIATIRKMQRIDVPSHVADIGNRWRAGLESLSGKHGVPMTFSGHPAISKFAFDHPDSLALETLFTVRMLNHGILAATALYATLAHQPEHVDRYLTAANEIFPELRQAIENHNAATRIGGPIHHTGFRRLT
ncbi:MAG: aminotransferase class III-fold pyridoxal phosphate-dependent enzyme [Acidobacteria bacterium]|nr:aminotransferase class III-fold pyridoxal phosphate-dependent enzyme [Acidobacteriota bacterium]